MPYLRGEDIIIGVGAEATRGSAVAPQAWIPGRTPSGIKPVLEKTLIKETRGSKVATHSSEITQKRAEGDLEFNVRSESIGYLLKSLLGAVSSGVADGETTVYEHVFTVLPEDPEHPSLTIGLHQPNQQDYAYALGIVSSIEFKIAPNDLVVATVNFIAKSETEKAGPAYVPAISSVDYYFRHQDVAIYLAADLAGLDAADPVSVKDFSVVISNNARPDQNASELNPGNVLGLVIEPKGTFMADQLGKTNHDIFTAGTYKALRIAMTRSDVTLGNAENPTIKIDFARVSFEGWDPDRPIDDVAKEKIEFNAHYSEADAKAVEITVVNATENYDSAEESS